MLHTKPIVKVTSRSGMNPESFPAILLIHPPTGNGYFTQALSTQFAQSSAALLPRWLTEI